MLFKVNYTCIQIYHPSAWRIISAQKRGSKLGYSREKTHFIYCCILNARFTLGVQPIFVKNKLALRRQRTTIVNEMIEHRERK